MRVNQNAIFPHNPMIALPPSLIRLTEEFSKLPGIGKKTAQRLALNLLKYDTESAEQLADAIVSLKQQVRHCSQCFSLTEEPVCAICQNPQRNPQVICVVEQPANVFTIERSHVFEGVYHVLMGAISPLDGMGPDQIKFQELLKRVQEQNTQELILATNPTVEGEATALFLLQEFEKRVPTITRLARGLPAGGDLEYVDDVTLLQAFSGRQGFATP